MVRWCVVARGDGSAGRGEAGDKSSLARLGGGMVATNEARRKKSDVSFGEAAEWPSLA
jgi:hypothetical protein